MLSLPKNFETYDEKRRNAFLALYEVKKRGKKVVGTFCSYTPTELIHAAGAIPVGLCGNSEQGILEAETRLPKTLCPLIKSSYGLAMTGPRHEAAPGQGPRPCRGGLAHEKHDLRGAGASLPSRRYRFLPVGPGADRDPPGRLHRDDVVRCAG